MAKYPRLLTRTEKKLDTIGEELADVAIYLFGLSEMLGIDLYKEIEKKIEINKSRKYEERNGILQKQPTNFVLRFVGFCYFWS